MQEGQRMPPTPIQGRETLMEGADMRVRLLTLAQGQSIPWHYHRQTTDSFVCLQGTLVIETREPDEVVVLTASQRFEVPPGRPHLVRGEGDVPCQFLVLQGVGVYDNVKVV